MSEIKQEILEELANDFYPNDLMKRIAFKRGYTECKERMYSEEEVQTIIDSFIFNLKIYTPTFNSRQEWFEQFKKK